MSKTIMLIDFIRARHRHRGFPREHAGSFPGTNYLNIVRCIRAVHQDKIWVRAEELHFLVEAIAESTAPRILQCQRPPLLSKQERGVVRLVARRFDKPRDRPAAEV